MAEEDRVPNALGFGDGREGVFWGNLRIAFVLGGFVVFGRTGVLVVCFEQTETSPILPLRTAADLREGDSRSPEAKVSGTNNRDAHTSTHEAANYRVRPLPFVGESQRESLEELSCFTPDQTISGDDKRSEVLALFETGLQVLLLFLTLLRGQDFVGISESIRLSPYQSLGCQ